MWSQWKAMKKLTLDMVRAISSMFHSQPLTFRNCWSYRWGAGSSHAPLPSCTSSLLHLFPPASPVSPPLLTVLPPVTHFWAPALRKTYCKLSIHLITVQENQRKAVHSSLKEVVPCRAAQEVLNHHQSRYWATKAAEHIWEFGPH